MGLRCLIGHDFGEMQTDRDRHERGDEVVAIIREYRECERCGHTRVISENKEVRSASAGGRDAAESDEDAADDSVERSKPLDDVTAEEDDGVILEDELPGRQHGEWPNDRSGEADAGQDEEGGSEPAPWPEVEGEDEGYAAEPSDGGLEGVEFSSGLTPEAAAQDAGGGASTEDGDVIEASGGGDRGGFRRARPSPSPTSRQRSEAPETEFFCPECELTRPTEHSSLRPGDICPNCRLGYLTERER